ncbi:hypothetical protein IEQ34_000679 [Dendrobium chrysotoxum]|uniref:Uncharacterized protein n=1 Tax=Dendrobium chrysotoxum TaxID=161865 RepID=A0AAV7HP61_DENCH|nr:hypothetical protein IEQ34_000679 [Dendrobium chrysotoxum]
MELKLLLLTFFALCLVLGAAARPVKELRAVEPADQRARPCDAMADVKGKLEGKRKKYEALLLNLLPRGTAPPSGPAGGTNGMKN